MNPTFITTNLKNTWVDADSSAFWNFVCGQGLCAASAINFKTEDTKFSVEESDLLIISGFINQKLFSVLKSIRARMLKPNYCIVLGSCNSNIDNMISLNNNCENEFSIDYFIPGCPADERLLRQALAALSQK